VLSPELKPKIFQKVYSLRVQIKGDFAQIRIRIELLKHWISRYA